MNSLQPLGYISLKRTAVANQLHNDLSYIIALHEDFLFIVDSEDYYADEPLYASWGSPYIQVANTLRASQHKYLPTILQHMKYPVHYRWKIFTEYNKPAWQMHYLHESVKERDIPLQFFHYTDYNHSLAFIYRY